MEFYNRKDLEYWRKQAEIGRAVIIEIPPEMLLDLDIEELSRAHNAKISPEELAHWIEENREAFLEAVKGEEKNITEAEKLERELYGNTQRASTGQIPGRPEKTVPPNGNTLSKADTQDTGVAEGLPMPAGVKAEQKVSWIMAHTEFSEEQIGVIVEAMSQDLPPKYLLCFMKKEYSPSVMRQLMDYCTNLYQEERKNAPLPVESLNGRR